MDFLLSPLPGELVMVERQILAGLSLEGELESVVVVVLGWRCILVNALV